MNIIKVGVTLVLLVLLAGCVTSKLDSNFELATLNGSVVYSQRIALPPEAKVTVELQDLSTQYSGVARTLAKQSYSGVQAPVQFSLGYRKDEIENSHRYALIAKITVGNKLWFSSQKHYPVLTYGAPSNQIKITVIPVR